MSFTRVYSSFLFLTAIAIFQSDSIAHDAHEHDTEPQKPKAAAQIATKPRASVPRFPQIDALRKKSNPEEPLDEALGGKTLYGTPIWPRTPECFPAESRDVFWKMDQVPDGKTGKLRPLNFDKNNNGRLDDVSPFTPNPGNERDAIRGRNTWILWSGGNEGFWNWLAQDGYGFADFLVALDSRDRDTRFKRTGMINQPGFKTNTDPEKRILGLFLDLPDDKNGGPQLPAAPWDKDAQRPGRPSDHRGFKLFEPGDPKLYQETIRRLETMKDGVDTDIYGYPSGVVGLRLFLNPDYFGDTPAAEAARTSWNQRIIKGSNDRFYKDPNLSADPKLVRPFRVGMSCGFCHVGPHPLNPPVDPESPDWENLSSVIGNQYWKPQPLFANRIAPKSFIYHFLASQQPGTIDTSLISTDQINNSNSINAIFEVTARIGRARLNPPESQSNANLRVKNIEDNLPSILDPSQVTPRERERHTARVLLDGADSNGAFMALARVYLNIGTYYEEWNRCTNPIIGFMPQRPFAIETCQKNSVYWQVNETYRAQYLADFFTSEHVPSSEKNDPTSDQDAAAGRHNATQAMRLKYAKNSKGEQSRAAASILDLDTSEQRIAGRQVWLDNCAICHSSKQPERFTVKFADAPTSGTWENESTTEPGLIVLPAIYTDNDWAAFKKSPSYVSYLHDLQTLVEKDEPLKMDPLKDDHPFWIENYLSTDIRIPLTLVKTNPARGLGTNGLSTHVWDNFSSDGYKTLPAVGNLTYKDVINGQSAILKAPSGGRGYYRPATHASLWSTAPYIHNNALGLYLDDPSVKGRVVQFLDSIRRILWEERRADKKLVLSESELTWLKNPSTSDSTQPWDPDLIVTRPGDLRLSDPELTRNDDGFVYRVPNDTNFEIPSGHTRRLISGIAGPWLTSILECWGWLVLVVALLLIAWVNRIRYFGILLLLAAVTLLVLWLLGHFGAGTVQSTAVVLLMGIMDVLRLSPWIWWGIILILGGYGTLLVLADRNGEWKARWVTPAKIALLLVFFWSVGWSSPAVAIIAAIVAWAGWIWNPTLAVLTRTMVLGLAAVAAITGFAVHRFIQGQELLVVPFTNERIGPFPVKLGPIPRGTPVNLLMNIDPESPHFARAGVALTVAAAEIRTKNLEGKSAYDTFMRLAGPALIEASKCPDFELDHGHPFAFRLSDQEKNSLIAFLKTL